jgi:adenosine deaminase
MRHRRCFAAFLLASSVASVASGQTLSVERRFAELRKSPLELHAFLYAMPKGGDLHNHLSGAVYAESFLRAAAAEGLCINVRLLALAPRAPGGCADGQVPAANAQNDNTLANSLIDSFSMRDFVPSAGRSAHDHFFDTFNKFGAVDSTQFVAEVAARAAGQNESYLELMALSGGGAIANLGKQVGLDADFETTHQKLDAAGLGKAVAALRSRVDEMEAQRRQMLGCDQNPRSAPCLVEVRYVYQVLREFPKEQTFAQVLGGFALAASDPRVVAVNFVQPEDGLVSMRDYHLQMTMVEFARKLYPSVHITLHAGELAPGLVPPEGLRFHIREAVELGHAERIGHGVDVMYERDPVGLLKEMRAKNILVEINLTSNDVILGVSGDKHPFPVYRQYGVPVALSTDDEGVSRSQLTEEYERAVLTYHLTYSDLKRLVRNSLEYSFAPGKSYWASSAYQSIAAACAAGRHSDICREYLEKNDKARLEADLEDRFSAFEKTVGTPQ